jgi:molecular chaperone DnaK
MSTGKSDALHLQRTLTREKLEEMTGDLIERSVEICDRMLKEAKIRKEEIQDVILVGGMTRMPKVQESVRAYFGMEPSKNVHPDEVVALGAAVQAAALTQVGTVLLAGMRAPPTSSRRRAITRPR